MMWTGSFQAADWAIAESPLWASRALWSGSFQAADWAIAESALWASRALWSGSFQAADSAIAERLRGLRPIGNQRFPTQWLHLPKDLSADRIIVFCQKFPKHFCPCSDDVGVTNWRESIMAKRTKKKGTTKATETKTEWTRESTREVVAFDAHSFMETATAFERNLTREFEL